MDMTESDDDTDTPTVTPLPAPPCRVCGGPRIAAEATPTASGARIARSGCRGGNGLSSVTGWGE